MRWFTPLLIVAVLPGVAAPAAGQCIPEECLHCGESFTGTTVQKIKDFSDSPCVSMLCLLTLLVARFRTLRA